MSNVKFILKQIRSDNGRKKDQRETLTGLRLGSIGKVSIIEIDNNINAINSIRGMIRKVSHLIEVKEEI